MLCDYSNLHISLFKIVLPTMGVSSGVTTGLSQVGKTLLKGAHYPKLRKKVKK